MTTPIRIGGKFYLVRSALDELIRALRAQGYKVLGPTVVNGVVGLAPIESASQLPNGIRDQQAGGSYRLVDGQPELSFEYVVGPDGPKRHLFPPGQQLYRFHIDKQGFVLDEGPPQVPKLAFLGVRSCELAAIAVYDRVFALDDPRTFRCESEPWYLQVRQQSFFVAVNCTHPGGTCFCDSWGTGPEATQGFDLALTELRDGFLVQVGSKQGADLAAKLRLREPSGAEVELAELKLQRAREHMGRTLDVAGIRKLMDDTIEHPEWEEVAHRCLSCGNCTMVCPTCFCCTVTDSTDLSGTEVSRTRRWESCYTHQFTYTPIGPERNTIRGRYRHWLRHKVGTWWEQFNSSGCVGCGRCITWCPVGIDLTEEIPRLRNQPHQGADASTIRQEIDWS